MNTVVLIGSVLGITVVLGTLLAVLYERRFFGRNVATLLAIAPFFVMPTVSALVWKNMIMHPVYGLLARAFAALGLTPVDWFGRLRATEGMRSLNLGELAEMVRRPDSEDRIASSSVRS